ncbi:hypothetical protein VMCG_07148 [Cytospora schulzeri]|uniref:Uncharacterized protein n=1 Tax=Cytospora schulzeri TaxID=448051 RepID=A0A423W4Y0_9PEZI|nr:hypothetical protein VMCG_07148 [Valsa malicola]
MSVIGIATAHHPEEEVVLEEQIGTSPPKADHRGLGNMIYGGTGIQGSSQVNPGEATGKDQKVTSTGDNSHAGGKDDSKGESG